VISEDLAPLNKEELEPGQEIEAAVANIDTRRDRIRLSVKKLDYIKNQAMLEEINDNESHSLGDLIKDKFK
jgi:small subunit ribosomal protein S1